MRRLGFIYEMDQCTGCKACQVACKDKNQLETGTFFRRVSTFPHEGKFVHFSGGCRHCEEAACVKACKTEAMYIGDDLTTLHDAGKCIGCGACVWSCQYGAVSLSKEKGIASKCNSCRDLRAKGEDPACVGACPVYCLKFGEIRSLDQNKEPSFLSPAQPLNVLIKPVTAENQLEWAKMCQTLFRTESATMFLEEREAGMLPYEYVCYIGSECAGMLSLSVRNDYVEGTKTSPVAYIEGIYVKDQFRNQGVARELIEFAKDWGRAAGCSEMASDCELDNVVSACFHQKVGFEEANRLICFKMNLKGAE